MDQPATETSALPTPVKGGVSSAVLKALRVTGWTSITVGMLMLGFVAHQLWVTSFFASRAQAGLETELIERAATTEIVELPFVPGEGVVTNPGETLEPPTIVPREATGAILAYEPPAQGEPLATIRIPSINGYQSDDPLEWTFVEGVRLSHLKSGAGHMPDTPLPGLPGNAVISGHRTTYGAPFHNLDEVQVGDQIFVDDPVIGTHVYAVRSWNDYVAAYPDAASRSAQPLIDGAGVVVHRSALWVTESNQGAWLTLTTCHPKFSSAERLIIFAELVDGPNADVILALS
ncbi:MAG: sortase [Acidimicrobiia bacterium]|nr:sortase [Acidimicrobiia bacterium]NNC74733.1 class E sortase [Acidimicrobiia bacterium]